MQLYMVEVMEISKIFQVLLKLLKSYQSQEEKKDIRGKKQLPFLKCYVWNITARN